MKNKQMIWLRIVVLPVSLFALIVALDQNRSWLVVLSILLILSVIVWWYLDEIRFAKLREEKKEIYQKLLKSMGVRDLFVSLIEDELREPILMERIYSFDACKVQASLHGFYNGVEFTYLSLDCKGNKSFQGHLLRLAIKTTEEERVGVYDSFPYGKKSKMKTVIGRSSDFLEICVEGLDFMAFDRVENIEAGLQSLISEIDMVLEQENEND